MYVVNLKIPYYLGADHPKYLEMDTDYPDIDPFGTLDDAHTYVSSVGTPKTFPWFMEKESQNYFGPGYPLLFVKRFTQVYIKEAMKAFLEEGNGYWFKVYSFSGWINAISHALLEQLYKDHFFAKMMDGTIQKNSSIFKLWRSSFWKQNFFFARPEWNPRLPSLSNSRKSKHFMSR